MARRKETKAQRRRRVIRNRLIAAGVLLLLIILIIVILVSCNGKKKSTPEQESIPAQTTEETEPTTEDISSIINEKPVNLYTMNYGDMTCYKVTEFSSEWSPYEDLEAFGAFVSTADSFEFNSETEAHDETWNSVQTSTDYKIGYELSFDVNGEHKVITILKPGDIESNPDLYNGDYPDDEDYSGITGYMGAWVYDDLHQDGGPYTHITQSEVNDETLLTSIKLRPTPQSEEISNLVLRAFSYSSDKEFDANGNYIGNYAAQVTINRE